jgi:hypothetical protein
MFLCLVVLAQMLLPTAFAEARASEGDRCAVIGNASQSGKSKQTAHAHGQECAHCRPQAVFLAAPVAHPQVAVSSASEVAPPPGDDRCVVAALRVVPPATGPPAPVSRV